MKLTHIHGGIHPKDNKYAAADEIFKPKLTEEDVLYIPFIQHIGSIAIPVIKKSQQVVKGEMIAKAGEGISVPIHSPINGIVTYIGKIPHPTLGLVDGCIIEPTSDTEEYLELDVSGSLVDIVKSAGIIGMGGAGFPSWFKIHSTKQVDSLLINGSECEPYLTCDYALMLNYYKEILEATKLLKDFINAKYAFIAIEHNKLKAANILNDISKQYGIEIVVIPDKYPQGGEKQLIKTVLSRTVYQGKLPKDVGVLVHNVATIKAIYDAVYRKKPFFERIVTVSGVVNNPCNIIAKIGMTINSIFKYTKNNYDQTKQLIFGGPMTGVAVSNDSMPILKNTGAILQLPVVRNRIEEPCIRCGKCIAGCVMGLVPTEIENAYHNRDIKKMIELNITNCIECGSCSYVCPSSRPLAQSIKAGKKRVLAYNQKDKI